MSNDTPLPHVDPYWTADHPKVAPHIDIANSIINDKQSEQDYCDEVVQVAQIVQIVKSNPTWDQHDYVWERISQMLPPELRDWWRNPHVRRDFRRPRDAALYVRGDKPRDLHAKITDRLLKMGYKRMVFDGSDSDGIADFHRGEVSADALHAMAPHIVNPVAFYIKWTLDEPRPNRMAQMIAAGEVGTEAHRDALANACDSDAVSKDREAFTLEPNVTPNHADRIAMHMGNGGMARMVAACATNHDPGSDGDKMVCAQLGINGIARALLGVHRMKANIDGARLGQSVALSALPDLVAQLQDTNPDKVRRRIEDFVIEYPEPKPVPKTRKKANADANNS